MSEQPYIVSARKYRPATFKTVVGQKALTATLKNAIDTGRVAQAYLFTGPRGVGKTSCARIFAKTINCLTPTEDGEACGHCDSCRAIDEGNSYNIIELDAASNNSVDNMRQLIEQVNVPPQVGKYRIFIIDEVHMLSTSAFNAFLKTLEEPPTHVVFIMATTEKHKVLPTILSRCQIYDFKRITLEDIVEHLQYVAQQEGIEAEPAALNVIARKADGGMRDALSIFDQISASTFGHVTYQSTIENLNVLDSEYYFRLVNSFVAGDVAGALLIYKEIREKGFDSAFFVNGLAEHVRNLMVTVDPRTVGLLEVSRDMAAMYVDQAKAVPLRWYYEALKLLNDCDVQYRTATNKQLLVELYLIRLCQLSDTPVPVDGRQPMKPVQSTAPAQAPAAPAAPQRSTPGASQPQPAQSQVAPQHAAPQPDPRQAAASQAQTAGSTQTAPQAAPRTARRVASPRSTSIRIHADEDGGAEGADEGPRRNAFTEPDLLAAWDDYAKGVEKDNPMLAGIMGEYRPQPHEGLQYKVKVFTPSQKDALEHDLQKIATFIRDRVKNDGVAFVLDFQPQEAPRTATMTGIEFLRKVTEEKPYIADLLKNLDAEII